MSLLRICLIPIIVWLYCVKGDYQWTTIVLMLSGVTDVVDGYIARHFGMISDFGKVFDPIADKLTQVVMLYCLITRFPLMILPFIIMVIKETFAGVTGLLTVRKLNKVLGAVWHGKVTTLLLYAMMLVHLIWYNMSDKVSCIMISVCTAVMLFSATLYGIRNIKILTKKS